MNRRSMVWASTLAAVLAGLAGCAAMNTLVSDVSSFGEWPAGRTAGSFAFERLPSQQAQPALADALEQAARPALEAAGFRPAAPGQEPEVLVQLGVRVSQTARSPWDDPLWWRGGFGYWRHGPWSGPSWSLGMRYEAPRYEREVGLLIRDRASGKPLYESRALTEGSSRSDAALFAAMFRATLADFPRPALSPRQVTVTLDP